VEGETSSLTEGATEGSDEVEEESSLDTSEEGTVEVEVETDVEEEVETAGRAEQLETAIAKRASKAKDFFFIKMKFLSRQLCLYLF